MQFNKGHITISHILIIFYLAINKRCNIAGTGYIRVFAVTVRVSTTVIDGPNSLYPLSSNLLPRPSFQEECLDKGVATPL